MLSEDVNFKKKKQAASSVKYDESAPLSGDKDSCRKT